MRKDSRPGAVGEEIGVYGRLSGEGEVGEEESRASRTQEATGRFGWVEGDGSATSIVLVSCVWSAEATRGKRRHSLGLKGKDAAGVGGGERGSFAWVVLLIVMSSMELFDPVERERPLKKSAPWQCDPRRDWQQAARRCSRRCAV